MSTVQIQKVDQEMEVIQIESREQLMGVIKEFRTDIDKAGRKVLADADMLFFRGITAWVGWIDDIPVSINMTHFGKRRSHVWEPYANGYLAFTRVSERRKGYASGLTREVMNRAVTAGCVRFKALAGTILGYYLHKSLGDEFWALTDKREIVVDTPLVTSEYLVSIGREPFPTDKVPRTARKWTTRPEKLSQEELDAILAAGPLRYE